MSILKIHMPPAVCNYPLNRGELGWKPHPVLVDYLVSEDGRVFSSLTGREVVGGRSNHGYVSHILKLDSGRRLFRAHRLVFEAWVGPIPPGYVIDHIDAVRDHNHWTNLQAVTPVQNTLLTIARGRNERGDSHHMRKWKLLGMAPRYRLKVPDADLGNIVARVQAGETRKDIGREYNCSGQAISNALRRFNPRR